MLQARWIVCSDEVSEFLNRKPALLLKRLRHDNLLSVEIDIGPPQTQNLASAQAGCCGQEYRHVKTSPFQQTQEKSGLVLLPLDSGWFNSKERVSGNKLPLKSLIERLVKEAMKMDDALRRQPSFAVLPPLRQRPAVECLEVKR